MKYVCKRILMLLVTMVIVSFLAFAAFDLISGSPAEIMLGTQATPERVAELERDARQAEADREENALLRELLELPEGMGVACLMPLGYPAEAPGAPKRKEVAELLTIK